MTRYTVTWSPAAENQLAQVWVDAPDKRDAITAASHTIGALLATDPETKGAHVHEGLRSLDVPPLHVLFRVEEQDRIVRVALVRIDEVSPPSSQSNGQVNREQPERPGDH